MINLVIGRTGSGKDYLAEQLEKRGLKILKSYATRPKRTENEDTHIFISPDEVSNYPDKVATTNINGYDYFATAEQIRNCDVYVIDPNGMKELTKNVTGVTFNIIHVTASPEERKFYAVRRVELKDKIKEEELFKQRSESENEQFSEFEDEMTSYENGLTAYPDNVCSVMAYYNHYDEAETNGVADNIAEYTRIFKKTLGVVLEIANDTDEKSGKIIMSDKENGKIKVLMSDNEYSPEIEIEMFVQRLMSDKTLHLSLLTYWLDISPRFTDLI